MIANTQKPLFFDGLGMFIVNLETFTTVRRKTARFKSLPILVEVEEHNSIKLKLKFQMMRKAYSYYVVFRTASFKQIDIEVDWVFFISEFLCYEKFEKNQ